VRAPALGSSAVFPAPVGLLPRAPAFGSSAVMPPCFPPAPPASLLRPGGRVLARWLAGAPLTARLGSRSGRARSGRRRAAIHLAALCLRMGGRKSRDQSSAGDAV
jgi:hypothetical protein